jgi:ferredoxin-type protein NapG
MSKDDQAKPATARTDTDRRRFFGDVIRGVSALACIGLPLGLLAKRSAARPAEAIRPPGAGAEDDFLAGVEEPVATGTPFFIARDVPCEMCEDIPCVAACPTGALDKDLTQIDDARMGTAVIVGHETCLNYQGLRCDVCYRICPLINEAITLERQANLRTGKHALFIPVVHSDKCTGCGKCEKACVLQEAAIKVLPTKIATGELGAHYRWGWVEKEKAGKSLLNRDILDLPDRRPGGGGS